LRNAALHVSGDYVPIISRNNCVYVILRICYSAWMTGMQGGMKTLHTRQSSTQYNKYQVVSPDDGHIVGRNM